MFAILNDDNIVVDCWIASSFDEAQKDNPTKKIVEMTLENTPASLGMYYNGTRFIERKQ